MSGALLAEASLRAVIQRVHNAAVIVDECTIGAIERGILVFLGVGKDDTAADSRYLVEKIVNLRIFPDGAGKMNCSLLDIGGELLVVSQFTLYGDCRKGRRPSFDNAAQPDAAKALYEQFTDYCRTLGLKVATGRFQADMQVLLQNDGPVTFMLESK